MIDAVEILPLLYTHIVIPETVGRELRQAKTPAFVRALMEQPPEWLTIAEDPPREGAASLLDPGETAAIDLADSLSASRLLIDDLTGRTEAERRGLKVTGTLGALAAAHRAGLIDFHAAVDRLCATNFYISPRLLAAVKRLL